ncbi:C2 family cysteine protease [Arthrobacter sp. E3]|uniref:C2 family cysteine protease n=1 Tax=Arthrobacter sp. E3 TaxID=517402 RepID=UPI0032B4E423
MGDFLGADVDQLREFARDLVSASEKLSQTGSMLSQRIAQNRGWHGPDAQRFSMDWSTRLRPTLAKVAAGLASVGREVKIQADEQETASSASGMGSGASSPRYADPGQEDLSDNELKDLKTLVDKAADSSNPFRGNDKDVQNLREALDKLSPAELEQFLKTLSDADLKSLADGAGASGKGLFDWQGTTAFERQGLLDQLLSKASPEQVERIKEQFQWAQPDGTSQGDAARPGGAKPDESNRWMTPEGPVIGPDPDKDDINQGGYGDCVVLAGAGALVASDPAWVREHVVDNGNGTVSVKLFDKDGNEQWVSVTSDLPANQYGDPKGARPGENGSWPAYVEKALVQVYGEDNARDTVAKGAPADQAFDPGHYRAIEGNYGPDALGYLTGKDIDQTRDAQKLWQAVENNQPAIVTTRGEVPDGAPNGYHAGHAYFVEGTDGNGNLILQNPWGPDEPKMVITPDQFEGLFQNASVVSK